MYIWFIFHWLAMSHCCYNPVIYCYMNARFRIGFLQVLHFIPGIRRCCCINSYARNRSTSLRTNIALTGKFFLLFFWYLFFFRLILLRSFFFLSGFSHFQFLVSHPIIIESTPHISFYYYYSQRK